MTTPEDVERLKLAVDEATRAYREALKALQSDCPHAVNDLALHAQHNTPRPHSTVFCKRCGSLYEIHGSR